MTNGLHFGIIRNLAMYYLIGFAFLVPTAILLLGFASARRTPANPSRVDPKPSHPLSDTDDRKRASFPLPKPPPLPDRSVVRGQNGEGFMNAHLTAAESSGPRIRI